MVRLLLWRTSPDNLNSPRALSSPVFSLELPQYCTISNRHRHRRRRRRLHHDDNNSNRSDAPRLSHRGVSRVLCDGGNLNNSLSRAFAPNRAVLLRGTNRNRRRLRLHVLGILERFGLDQVSLSRLANQNPHENHRYEHTPKKTGEEIFN
jgi:hypothetical protein